MKTFRLTTLTFLLAGGAFVMGAAPLSPDQALARIRTSGSAKKVRAVAADCSLRYTLDDASKLPALYVFDRGNGAGGFLVVSADDAAAPLLGYCDEGQFDPGNIPPSLSYWLNQYSAQIAAARKAGRAASSSGELDTPSTEMEAVGPLLKSKWNQGAPYNKYCFTINADSTETQSVTGCVATSMAQVMYYFKKPAVGHGEISYKHGDSGTYSMNFAAQPFDWDEMLPTYVSGQYTEDEGDAVAYLMKACGYSVKMDYGKGESGADGANIAGALIDYFGYNPNIELQTRAFYTYNDWVTMIYNNLKNVGPVVYNGSALDGGHSFVCDGYDGNGYFHINWGWGGMSDGDYLLDALNPDEFGIGGAAGGYNLGQQVILNISPETTAAIQPTLMQFGSAPAEVTDGTLKISLDDASNPGFQYINPTAVTVTFGLKVVNDSDPTAEPTYLESTKKNLDAKQSSYFHWDEVGTDVDLSKLDMATGDEYTFVLSTFITQSSGESGWSETVPVPGKYNYVTVERTSDGYEVLANTLGEITVTDFKVESSPVYWNNPVEFSATFANASDTQLTRNYSAVFFNSNGKECYKMENYSINVDSGATVDDSWTSIDWYKEDGATDVTEATQFTVKLYDNWLGQYVTGAETTVTVEPEAPKATVESSREIVNGTKNGDEYVIEGDSLEVSLTVKVTEGVFNHTLMLALQEEMKENDFVTVMHKHFDAIPNLTAGQQETYTMTVAIDDVVYGKTYRVEVWGPDDGFNEKVLVQFKALTDGVSNPDAGAEGPFVVYRIDGTPAGTFSSPDALNSLPSGLYIVNGHKILR